MTRRPRLTLGVFAVLIALLALPAASSADVLKGTKTIRWRTTTGAINSLTVNVNYTATYFGAAVRVKGYAQAKTALPVQRVCIQHFWGLDYRRGSGTDRPVNELESTNMDYTGNKVTTSGNRFFFRGPFKQTINNRNAGFSFPSSNPLGWTALSRRSSDAQVTVRGYVSSAQRGCGRPLFSTEVTVD